MLDPWIIKEILRREEDRRRENERGRLEFPLESPPYRDHKPPTDNSNESDRGVIVIDI